MAESGVSFVVIFERIKGRGFFFTEMAGGLSMFREGFCRAKYGGL